MKKEEHPFPWGELRYVLWLPVYLLCFFILERLPERAYWDTQLPSDAWIPFNSWFVIPYCSWFFLLILSGIAVLGRNVQAFRRYMRFLSLTFLSAVVLWVFLPTGQDLRPVQPDGPLGPAVALLYRIDTNTNVFPSLHVAGAIGAALAVWDAFGTRNRPACWAVTALAALITASTLLIKQHSILDIAGAAVFSVIAGILVYGVPNFRQETA